MKYMLDTDICIYAMKNRPPQVLARLREEGPEAMALSILTILELRQGAEGGQDPAADHSRIDFFTSPMQVVPFMMEDAFIGARLRADLARRGRPIGAFDSLIASQALARKLILVTNNLREFERVEGLQLENWAG